MADLPPLATVEQLAGRLGYTPTGTEATRAQELLASASALIRDEAGKDWIDPVTGQLLDVPSRVERICVEVAYRAFVNPEALTQRTLGDSAKGYDRARVSGGEAVYLTSSERRAVLRAAGRSTTAAVTLVSPWSGDLETA